jgi:hypothetical protein
MVMRIRNGLMAFALGAMLLSAAVARADESDLPRNPGAAFGAAGINLVYAPLRLALSTVWACVSGTTGWLTGGNETAADDVWSLTQGPGYVTPGMLTRRERFRFGNWETGH